MNWLALDIGGANVKVADGRGYARSYTFYLWKDSASLAGKLRTILAESPASDHLAVTMTGELADCFESKTDGVRFILDAIDKGCDNRHLRIYLVDGRLVSPAVARQDPQLAAASNWRALAQFAGRYAPQGPALLIDVGSTTCDVIPLVDGTPVAKGRTDTQRLLADELVYTGVERSPICAIISQAPYRGRTCSVTQELFATMLDAYLVLGILPEDPAGEHTADGRPATKAAATARLGRMLAADSTEFGEPDALAMAHAATRAQAELLATAITHVVAAMTSPPAHVILSGHGDFLATAALREVRIDAPVIRLSQQLDPSVARVGPAHALAVLAREAVNP